jgi:6-pyruvoyltetrahydropterin/6-carboxytetrahydropterin synthase
MYQLSLRRAFSARHYLIGGDWGEENQPHAHEYVVELRLEGAELDRHGYLVDIVQLEASFGRVVDEYRDSMLNRKPAFKGLNPSIENFARILADGLAKELEPSKLSAVEIRIWESDIAWASFRRELT